MRRLSLVMVRVCTVLLFGTALAAEGLSDFKAKALDVIEKTRPAVQSSAFRELQEALKNKRIAVRFLTKGAYTSKFVNPKDKKEYLLTIVPMVSHFESAAAVPLAAVVVSDGKEFRAGRLQVSWDRKGKNVCDLVTGGGELIARSRAMELLKEPPLPVPKGEGAIAIAKDEKGDERILILCRTPYAGKGKAETECTAVIFYSGDLAWEKFAPPGKEK